MDERVANLINGYLDEVLSVSEMQELEDWINQDPRNAKQFADAVVLDNKIQAEICGAYLLEEAPSFERYIPLRHAGWPLAALAATILIVALLWPGNTDQSSPIEPSDVLATIAQTVNAEFDQRVWNRGDVVSAQDTVKLKSGVARLLFGNGVELTLQGPAEYLLLTSQNTFLSSGLLSATVPVGAEGFTVDTPAGEIVDLGTAFGVELDASGDSKVVVFDGKLEVRPANQKEHQQVNEGEAIWLSKDRIESAKFDTTVYEKLWPVSSGIKGSTGDFRFAPQWPRPLNLVQSNSKIFVLPEGYSVTLESDIELDISQPGTYQNKDRLTSTTLPSGQRVKSYLLQFNPVDPRGNRGPNAGPGARGPRNRRPKIGGGNQRPGPIKRIAGQITFENRIIGLIVSGEQLRTTDGIFSNRSGRGPQMMRGLEMEDLVIADRVTLSDDRRTIELDLAAIGKGSDHVRVIVDDSIPEKLTPSK